MQTCPLCGATYRNADARFCYRCATPLSSVLPVGTDALAFEQVRPIVLGIDTVTGQSVSIPFDLRVRGTYNIGKNGTGKTTLIEGMVVQDMQAGHGLCLLDPHGDLKNNVLARVPPEREDDIILWDITDVEYPFGLNLYECQNPHSPEQREMQVDQVVETFAKIWEDVSWGPRIEEVLVNTAITLVENPGMTMAEIPKLLADAAFRARLVANVRNKNVRDFWDRYDRKKLPDQDAYTESTLNKMNRFLSQDTLYHIVGQSKTAINFRAVMDTGKVLFVRLDAQRKTLTKLVGSVIVGQILSAALSRADTAYRRPFFLYADEYPFFATPSFAELIDQARKYNVSTVIAHQRRDQLDYEHRKAPLGAANLIVFAVQGADAEELALQFDHTPPPPEIIGQRAIPTLAIDPWDQLERGGHTNPVVPEVFVQVGKELRREVDRWTKDGQTMLHLWEYYHTGVHEWISSRNPVGSGPLRPGGSEEAANMSASTYQERLKFVINDYLHSRMQGKEFIKPAGLLALLVETHPHALGVTTPEEIEVRCRAFLELIVQLGDLLAAEPVLVNSGQYVPIYGLVRTYADMQNEIANSLANLAMHHAKVKLGGVEHLIATKKLPGVVWTSEVDAKLDRIRKRSQRTYGKLVAEVIQEIERRQAMIPPPKTRR